MLTIPRMASTLPDMISKIVFLGTWVSDMLEFSVIDSGAASWGGSVSLQFSMTGLESSSCSIYGKRNGKKCTVEDVNAQLSESDHESRQR